MVLVVDAVAAGRPGHCLCCRATAAGAPLPEAAAVDGAGAVRRGLGGGGGVLGTHVSRLCVFDAQLQRAALSNQPLE